jgi:hypothetical protein
LIPASAPNHDTGFVRMNKKTDLRIFTSPSNLNQ